MSLKKIIILISVFVVLLIAGLLIALFFIKNSPVYRCNLPNPKTININSVNVAFFQADAQKYLKAIRVDEAQGKKLDKTTIYSDDNNCEYTYRQSDGRLIGYSNNQKVKGSKDKVDFNYIVMADNFLKEIVTLSEYQPGILEKMDKDIYVRYVRKIYGFDTIDTLTVHFDKYGRITKFETPNVGLFDGVQIAKIDQKYVDSELDAKIANDFSDRFHSQKIQYLVMSLNHDKTPYFDVSTVVYLKGETQPDYHEYILDIK